MKIHIVKKGDTLWKIAEMYHVDFEELKQMNAHLAEPDMIMPGMKIRIPVHKESMKKEQSKVKEKKKEQIAPIAEEPKPEKIVLKKHVKKEMPQQTKPIEQIKEDDVKEYKPVQPVVPFEQEKSPELSMPTTPVLPAKQALPTMPNQTYKSPVQKGKKEEKKAIPNKEPMMQEDEKEKQGHSIPLTSHGCHCYCGSCTPMHFGHMHEAPVMYHPPQQPAQMMPAQHPQYYPPMMQQGQNGYQMMPVMPLQQPVSPCNGQQPYQYMVDPSHMQQHQQMNQMHYMPEAHAQEERSSEQVEEAPENQSTQMKETYPPIYSEERERSIPQPPPGSVKESSNEDHVH